MAGRGRRYMFHGAYKSKARAERKERSRPGSFIREVHIKRRKRYLVMKER